MILHVLGAGAAKGLVADLTEAFTAATGAAIRGVFGPVGAIGDQLGAGHSCDVFISTANEIERFTARGFLRAGSPAPIGTVRTAMAVPEGFPVPDISSSAAFAATLRAAGALYLPDPDKSTAGVHVLGVLKTLGLDTALGSRLRAFPNGALAMRTMADERTAGALGCAQATEITYTAGLTPVGPLPAEYDLSTLYVVAMSASTAAPDLAQRLIDDLTGAGSRHPRIKSGFEI